MVRCDRCGIDVYMPFRCNYCGGYFCEEHRLPEFHDCPSIKRGSGAVNLGGQGTQRPPGTFYQHPGTGPVYIGRFWFSRREIRDLLVGLLIIAALPLTWFWSYLLRGPTFVLGAVGIFAAAFLLHELAHKFSAQRLGYWSEFRLNMFGLLITLISFFSPLKIVAPGAVVIAGPMFSKEYGVISLAGPLTNIAQAVVFLIINLVTGSSLSWIGVYINAILALFNLIPLGLFDGAKIFRWSWKVWLVVIIIAGLLFIFTQI